MTPLNLAAAQAGISTLALRSPLRGRKPSFADALADPRVRLGAGTASLLVTAIPLHPRPVRRAAPLPVPRDRAARCEAVTCRAVNDLPSWLYPPAWVVMQLGTLGAAPPAARAGWAGRGAARRRGRHGAGGRRRRRAGLAAALGAAPLPRLGPASRAVTLSAAPIVGLTRIYVGAHLPLDVA